MSHTFNNGTLTVTGDTISYSKFLRGSATLQRHKISSIIYQYDNIVYKVLRIPLGLLYVGLIIGLPIGIRCLRGDILAHVKMTNGEMHTFWVYGNEISRFKSVL